MLELKSKHLEIIKEILKKYVPEMTVLAYGSRVTGQSHPGSDLDLVVINPQNISLPLKNLTALRAAFTESNLPFIVDVHDWAMIPELFRNNIKKNHHLLFGEQVKI
ncbi:MAG: nucleotidyltransferase family protein [Gammaproteobacteria bacterium]